MIRSSYYIFILFFVSRRESLVNDSALAGKKALRAEYSQGFERAIFHIMSRLVSGRQPGRIN